VHRKGHSLVKDLTWDSERQMLEDALVLVEDFYK
jgi:hypothetical protein